MKIKIAIIPILLTILTNGCHHNIYNHQPEPDYYYINPDKNISATGRVAMIELVNQSNYHSISSEISQKLYEGFQKIQLFGINLVKKQNPNWQSLQINPLEELTLQQMANISQNLKCDAILTGVVTQYKPYPHLKIGLRLKMIDLNNGQLIWAAEQIWEASDKNTQQRIEHYYYDYLEQDYAPTKKQVISISSTEFIKYVAYELGRTFKPNK